MFCRYCGNEVDDNSKFCPNCGRDLENDVVVVENVEPVNTIPVNTNSANTTTTKDPNTGQTVVYVTNEVKKDEPTSCISCLGYIFLLIIILAILGSCVA